ncbi:MAG: hypothetical protein IT312_16235 [Anaerolineales bacterium]|nr:hypothetical protein [Anaerolineales bacterium]
MSVVFGFAAANALPISVKASVNEEAAKIVNVIEFDATEFEEQLAEKKVSKITSNKNRFILFLKQDDS